MGTFVSRYQERRDRDRDRENVANAMHTYTIRSLPYLHRAKHFALFLSSTANAVSYGNWIHRTLELGLGVDDRHTHICMFVCDEIAVFLSFFRSLYIHTEYGHS